jgi:very-short-patch-repair endonuclease
VDGGRALADFSLTLVGMRLRGVYSWAELIELGLRRKDIELLVKNNDLTRLRQGWYATTDANWRVVEAVTKGGVLTCVDALAHHGVWVPEELTKSVHVRGNARATRAHPTFCRQYGRPEPETGAIDDIRIAFRHAVRCLSPEGIVAVADSILNQELLEIADLRGELSAAPAAVRELLERCDAMADSGAESLVRFRLYSARVSVRVQVAIEGVGTVDLMIGDRLIIEVDGDRYHRTKEQMEEDKRRDRAAASQGYITLRLTYGAVVDTWEDTLDVILDIVRRKDHLWPRKRGPKRDEASA